MSFEDEGRVFGLRTERKQLLLDQLDCSSRNWLWRQKTKQWKPGDNITESLDGAAPVVRHLARSREIPLPRP